MRIIVISGSFEPKISPRSFRTTELVKELSKMGHEVVLYVPYDGFSHEDFIKNYRVTIKYYKKPIDKFANTQNRFLYFINRCLAHGIEYPEVMIMKYLKRALKGESKDYDLLISIAVPHPIHWTIGRMYKKGNKLAKVWVADCGDPYMLCGTLNIKHPFYFKYIEKLWCRLCDYITVPTKGAINGFYPEFKEKIRVIPQAFNFEEVEKVKVHYVKNKVPTFAYSGSIWSGNKDPRPFLDYLKEVKQDFRFYIFTNSIQVLDSYKDELKDKLIVSPFIPRLELLKKLSGMDFLVHFEFHTSVQTPSKLIDYTLSGRPILAINIRHIDENAINDFLSGDYKNQYVVENMEQYDIKFVAKQFVDLANN